MTSILDLPRELFLEVCSQLAPTEVTGLGAVCRDLYLAVQQPLYSRIRLTSYGSLVKLIGTLTKSPVVSKLTARCARAHYEKVFPLSKLTNSCRQRLRWWKLSDYELQDRDIQYLDLTLDTRKDMAKITGAVAAGCIGAVSRKCSNVRITLRLHGAWAGFQKQWTNVALPNVITLVAHLGGAGTIEALTTKIWDICFSGSTFPDLRHIELNTRHGAPEDVPDSLRSAVVSYSVGYGGHNHRNIVGSTTNLGPFYGLQSMKSIKLTHNNLLDTSILNSLLASSVVPKRLTRLEIVSCPYIHITQDLEALSMLLQRALPLLHHLKLHFPLSPGQIPRHADYRQQITAHPERHLCSIVRELGQKIGFLDLALPFACRRMLLPVSKQSRYAEERKEYPSISREPYNTLFERVLEAGYKYRRVIANSEAGCFHGDTFDDLRDLAKEQDNNVSWTVMCTRQKEGLWCVGECLPMAFDVNAALHQSFSDPKWPSKVAQDSDGESAEEDGEDF